MSEPEEWHRDVHGMSLPRWPMRFHRWLRELPDVQLWTVLFVSRALILAPVLVVFYFGKLETADAPKDFVSHIYSLTLLTYVLLVAPLVETLFECSLPHLVLKASVHRRPWQFALVSATLMVLVHPWGSASVFPFLTGLVLAYCYLLFLRRYRAIVAFAVTVGLHVAINLAGIALSMALMPHLVAAAA